MDLKTRGVPPTEAERDAVASVLGDAPAEQHERTSVGGQLRRAQRHLLLPTLHAVNDRVGWLSSEAIDHIAERLDIAPAEVYAVATFYELFSVAERPPHQVHVCVDVACRAAGGPTETSLPEGTHAAPCLGLCERAPAVFVTHAGNPVRQAVAGPVTAAEAEHLAGGSFPEAEPEPAAAVPLADTAGHVLLTRVGQPAARTLDGYRAAGGFAALAAAREMGADAVIAAVEASGLTGRGGAGFPTARKWSAVRSQPTGPHHLVCNADESEPGTFKDRVLMENDPFAVIEAMAIAGFATDAEHGWIYLRGEYPRARESLERAIAESRAAGLLQGFEITIVRGAGAYICGEETAIFSSIEGFRGEPRNKPPFPFQAGLFSKPTAVNNVETLVNVPHIVNAAAAGAPMMADRRLFCMSGAINRPGVYEAQVGITLGGLIELAGGLRDGSELQAVLLGGAAGGFAGPQDLDLELAPEPLRAAGLTLGSGVVMVHDQHVDMVDQLRRIAAFFRSESCGQCVPCRVGTVRQDEALARLADEVTAGDIALVREIAGVMRDASICGLGQTAANAIESAFDRLGVFS